VLQALYVLSLGIAAGICGAFGRRVVAEQGFAPDFDTGMLVAGAIALAYLCVELLYMGLVRLLKPSHSPLHIIGEGLSQSSAVVMLPYLLDWQVNWPHPLMARVDMLIYPAVFAALHLTFKIVSFFSALQAPSPGRVLAALWLGAAILCGSGTAAALRQWQHALVAARAAELAAREDFRVGETYSEGRRITEGGIFTLDVRERGPNGISLRWSNDPENERPLDTAYLILQPDTAEVAAWQEELVLEPDTWVTFQIGPDQLPEGVEEISLQWYRTEQPDWLLRSGVRPPVESELSLVMGGPDYPAPRGTLDIPNVVLVLFEGLGAEHLHVLGYQRETSAHLDRFAARSYSYQSAYTPAPEVAATAMTLFTGLNPLQHGYLGGRQGNLPEDVKTLAEVFRAAGYSTAAFTEGESATESDLTYGSGFERGFMFFNPAFPSVTTGAVNRPGTQQSIPRSVSVTLEKAAAWIEEHQGEKFFVFIRLRELRRPLQLQRYGRGFIHDLGNAIPIDVHDTAILNVDQAWGVFLDRLDATRDGTSTAIAVTSAYGLDFSEPGRGSWRRGGAGVPRMTETSLWVPLFLSVPYELGQRVRRPVALEDVGPTLLDIAELAFPHAPVGQSLLGPAREHPPVSLAEDPVVLSLRQDNWRFTWQSGHAPFTLEKVGEQGVLEFIDIPRYLENTWQSDNLKLEPQLARVLRDYLWDYLKIYSPAAAPAN